MITKILPRNYTPTDWKGNKVKPGDTVYLVRIFEIKYDLFSMTINVTVPDKSKPCWEVITTFNVTEYKEGAEKLIRYFHRYSGYDPNKIYDTPINGNDLRHGCGSDTYILCIKGLSDNRVHYEIHISQKST